MVVCWAGGGGSLLLNDTQPVTTSGRNKTARATRMAKHLRLAAHKTPPKRFGCLAASLAPGGDGAGGGAGGSGRLARIAPRQHPFEQLLQ